MDQRVASHRPLGEPQGLVAELLGALRERAGIGDAQTVEKGENSETRELHNVLVMPARWYRLEILRARMGLLHRSVAKVKPAGGQQGRSRMYRRAIRPLGGHAVESR